MVQESENRSAWMVFTGASLTWAAYGRKRKSELSP